MGKYIRKCRGAAGEEVAAVEVVGVRTRSRSASATVPAPAAGGVAKVAAARRRKALLPATEAPGESAAVDTGGDGGSCYLKLRSRMLFKAPPLAPTAPAEAARAGQGAVLAAALSRCSSTASSVDMSSAHQATSVACRSDAAEAGGDHIPEGSAGSNSRSRGHDRERREMTPSSRAHGEVSDLESDLARQKSGRSSPAATSPVRPRMLPAAEIEEFFAAAEEAEAKRFASKYNFDVVRGVPLDAGGRFEWAPVVSN